MKETHTRTWDVGFNNRKTQKSIPSGHRRLGSFVREWLSRSKLYHRSSSLAGSGDVVQPRCLSSSFQRVCWSPGVCSQSALGGPLKLQGEERERQEAHGLKSVWVRLILAGWGGEWAARNVRWGKTEQEKKVVSQVIIFTMLGKKIVQQLEI